MLYDLSETQFETFVAPALHRIFVQEDPYGQPFAPGVQERRLLCTQVTLQTTGCLSPQAFSY